MLVFKAVIKQSKVMVFEAPKGWDKWREQRAKPRKEPAKVELNGLEKTTIVGAKLSKAEVMRIAELLK